LIAISTTVAVSLIVLRYVVRNDGPGAWISNLPAFAFDLNALLRWSGGSVVFYLVVPLLVCCSLKLSPSDLGWNLRGLKSHALVYLWCFLPMMVLIFLVLHRPDFQATYPFYSSPGSFLSPHK
tara:strand:- start:7817 stop:8185 length:369 start_codon:yes stop_codon:yes gene_type:complete